MNISDLHKTVTFSVFSSLVCFLIGSVGTMSYVFYMILFSVFVLMLQHMTAFRFLFTQFVCTICSDSGGKRRWWWMMDGIDMELVNFPTGLLVEVQVN